MPYNPQIHHRRSIRLKGYDYSQEGLYFITLCCQDRACLFGEIVDGKMVLNDAGKVAQECWLAIPHHFKKAVLHSFIIMPNHVHGIIELVGAKGLSPDKVGAKDSAKDKDETKSLSLDKVGAKDLSPLQPIQPLQPKGTSRTIGSVVRGFKIGVTKWMREYTAIHDVWQRDYYEHIIRNEKSYHNIADYIEDNPRRWYEDKLCNK